MSIRTRLLSFGLGAGLLTAGCSDSPSGPTLAEFDADAASADFEAMSDVFAGDLWESFGVLGELFPTGSPAAQMAFAIQGTAGLAASGSSEATPAYLEAAAAAFAAQVPKIPFEIRGTTYVLDPETLRYVASDLEGAPENGIRFILYAVNPVTHKPLPDVPIGYTDIIDLGDELENGVSLRVIVVADEITHFDYTVTAIHETDRAGSLDVSGFVSRGETTVAFEIGIDVEQTETSRVMETAFVLEIEARDFRAAGTVRHAGGEDGRAHDLDVEIRHGEHVIVFTRSVAAGAVTGEVHVNGELFATISGDPEHPVILGPDGRELTERERRALRHIMAITEHVFRMVDHLLRPAERILNLEFFRRDR
jgi:hypothetical protein